jgi:hypothetical protein
VTPEQLLQTSDVIVRARDVIEAQNKEIAGLRDKVEALESSLELLSKYVEAVEDHNQSCTVTCNDGANCGYSGYLKRTGRRCSSCPVDFKVDVMPHKGSG